MTTSALTELTADPRERMRDCAHSLLRWDEPKGRQTSSTRNTVLGAASSICVAGGEVRRLAAVDAAGIAGGAQQHLPAGRRCACIGVVELQAPQAERRVRRVVAPRAPGRPRRAARPGRRVG